jgi:uncharacterized Fe-S cluster-containing MiaB family protein
MSLDMQSERIKLYNASNFFDNRAVPPEDLPAIARLVRHFGGVTVESHASTVGEHARQFAGMLDGRLEVAIGLETIHPRGLAELNKRSSLTRFDSAADYLAQQDIDLRVFVLLNAPYVPPSEAVDWTVRAVEYAAERGASVVAIIPVRGGNGEMERLASLGEFTPTTLGALEAALDRSLGHPSTVVTVDLWDVERLVSCAACGPARIARLAQINLSGKPEVRIPCSMCDGR